MGIISGEVRLPSLKDKIRKEAEELAKATEVKPKAKAEELKGRTIKSKKK